MKLAGITDSHIKLAAKEIDFSGIQHNSINNKYWVKVGKREYPFKYLTNEAYKLANNTKEDLDFQSTKPYRDYVEGLGFKIKFYPQNLNFFKGYEIEDYNKVAGLKYRKSNDENVRYSKLILPNVKKINFWAANSLIEDFYAQKDNHWQWSGTFKSYLWIRIYRKGGSKKVYFVLGINEDGNLSIHLNCQRSNHTGGKTKALPQHLINNFDSYLNDADYSPKYITPEILKNYNWETLIEFTQNYFYDYASLYDELESLIKTIDLTATKQQFTLFPSNIPDETKSYVNRQRSFKGQKTNWSKKQVVSSKLGLLGEELVIHIERKKLEKIGLTDKAEKVEKKLDGEGYDILSFDENENEIYIEVKTTTGNSDEPFYLSINEKVFCDLNRDKYMIYRLHNYNYQNKTAKIYKVSGKELYTFDLLPTNFEVSKSTQK
ncbi:DUF3883 domain-containing protein [Winogradskyella schleiferi]|uniref:DUF3883 domain-containing protein n=1 Tax=Winogradskyella schleiferi TaxID=2686078 RepID=UPI0015B7E81B|nr:DUF3883 domain-containing protein [Winogradskyella schleiferi]